MSLAISGGRLWSFVKDTGLAAADAAAAGGARLAATVSAQAREAYERRQEMAGAASAAASDAFARSVASAKAVGAAPVSAAKAACDEAVRLASAAYDRRQLAYGVFAGAAAGVKGMPGNVLAHFGHAESAELLGTILKAQGVLYHAYAGRLAVQTEGVAGRETLLDSIVVGGKTLASYIDTGTVPPDVQQAYELAYPNLSTRLSFADEAGRLDADQLRGFAACVKGKLFELKYLAELNDGLLPDGYKAELADTANNAGWDIRIVGPDDEIANLIQLKATDSMSHVARALEKYPDIDVVTTSEVHSHFAMIGVSEQVADSHIANHLLGATVDNGIDQALGSMHWMPSATALALIAFTTYKRADLAAYEKAKLFGDRSALSYATYLAGGGITLATGFWWIGVAGGAGARFVLGKGRQKREQLAKMLALVAKNRALLDDLASRSENPGSALRTSASD